MVLNNVNQQIVLPARPAAGRPVRRARVLPLPRMPRTATDRGGLRPGGPHKWRWRSRSAATAARDRAVAGLPARGRPAALAIRLERSSARAATARGRRLPRRFRSEGRSRGPGSSPAPGRRGPRRRRTGPRPRAATSNVSGPDSASTLHPVGERSCRCPRSPRRGRPASSPGGTAPAPRRSPARARGALPAGTISVSRPIASASSASTIRPVRIRSSARPRPTIRGSRWVPPSISGTPKRRSVKPSREPSVGHAQVAPQRQLQPAGQAPAADRGDRRLGRRQPA